MDNEALEKTNFMKREEWCSKAIISLIYYLFQEMVGKKNIQSQFSTILQDTSPSLYVKREITTFDYSKCVRIVGFHISIRNILKSDFCKTEIAI